MSLSLLSRYHATFNTSRHKEMLKEAEKKQQWQKALAQSLEHWRNTDIGTYFDQRIAADKAKALDELARANPEDQEQIRALQAKIAVINTINQYIAEVLLTASTIK